MTAALGAAFVWDACAPAEQARLRRALARFAPEQMSDLRIARMRAARVPFLRSCSLYEIAIMGIEADAYVLYADDAELVWLDGSSDALYTGNEVHGLELRPEAMLDYLRYFLFFMRSGDVPFVLLESPEALQPGDAPKERLAQLRAQVTAPRMLPDPAPDGRRRAEAVIAYEGGMFRAVLAVGADGGVEMLEDTPLGMLDGAQAPMLARLARDPRPARRATRRDAEALPQNAGGAERPDGVQDDGAAEGAAPRPPGPAHASDHQVTASVVSVLLARAVVEAMSHMLLQRFNTESQPDGPLGQLARFVRAFAPIVVIESEIPFVETIVAEIVAPNVRADRATAMRELSDDLRCHVDADSAGAALHLVSFHAYRRMWDPEWTAHRLALGSAAVFIGCDRRADVPEPLRRVADLVLTLPRIDVDLFPAIYAKVFGAPPPGDWDRDGVEWVRYLLHSDFHAPTRLSLSPAESVEYLRSRSRARLEQVSAIDSPRLEDLHGLGEARQIAEDLVADIAAAREGSIPWAAVDRGLLLAGPPGTGKTTLGRAIARASGIKFVIGSAAQWQSAGALDSHLRAIRETFAEARRYAPAILFIDEIDSIGNRETFTGNSAVYQTEVVNALLEQMQGMSEDEPVIVIGATNHVEKVDPALRRAGRLDQVVAIPRPSVAGLEKIIEYHLRGLRRERRVADDVDVPALAQLAFGCTGADVEFFVRGAARRARKAARSVRHADLLAEITRRPRHPDGVLRLTEDDMRRVAVHEAGHAVAMLAHPATAERITFVTIVPRNDGSLGFVASAHPGGVVVTREHVLLHLRVVLAGRAAEQLVYGRDGVGLGAGIGASSDLAIATRVATELVCAAGLGDDGGLHWTQTPTRAQLRAIEALLRRSERAALGLLRAERALLDRVADLLVREQEIDGATLRRLVGDGAERPAGQRRRTTPGPRRTRRPAGNA